MEMKIADKCIICTNEIKDQGVILCLKCGKPCTVTPVDQSKIESSEEGDMVSTNVKSDCCQSDVNLAGIKSTCSEECHDALVEKMEEQVGSKFIEETDMHGDIRIIPVRDIISLGGLSEEAIMKYPKKGEHHHKEGETCYACENGADAFKKHQDELMAKYGWVIHYVSPMPGDDRFNIHTHGLQEKYEHPDLQIMIAGLDPKIAGKILHNVVDKIEAGEKFEVGNYGGIIKNLEVQFVVAPEGDRIVLRMIFPNPEGKFEGEFYENQIKDLN
jgi:hypothetical protein